MTASFISFFLWAERFDRFFLDLLKNSIKFKQKCKVVEGLFQTEPSNVIESAISVGINVWIVKIGEDNGPRFLVVDPGIH
jgi:hypothetical protein